MAWSPVRLPMERLIPGHGDEGQDLRLHLIDSVQDGLHHGGIVSGNEIGQQRRAGCALDPFGIVSILHPKRNPMQGPSISAPGDLLLSGTSRLERLIPGHGDESQDLRFHLIDPVQDGLGQLERRELSVSDELSRFGDTQEMQVG